MRDIHRLAGLAQASRDLEMAAGIGGRDEAARVASR